MSELVPIPLPLLLRRAFLEYEREGKIFDLPKAKFFRGLPGLDTSVRFHGHAASTPLGPAAGPHDQLVQNIVLSWLGGSRIIELKTVQILDELKIPRPCIDIINVGYNVEWSQELRLEQSLREYVGAAMFIEILKASKLLGEDFPGDWGDTIFDMSVGYDLKGISSPRVRAWMERMMDATAIVNELRSTLTGPWARYRDLPFPTRISDTLTLSTFHGCPAGEIEGIVSFLLTEMDLNVCVKLNPTLLGKAHVEHLLHDVLGYHDLLVTQEAFDKDLQWAEAMEMIPRLDRLARSRGKRLAVKFSNTLVVKNHRTFFTDEVMYMSGAPLHVLTLNLVQKFREHMGAAIPISFSAGLDSNNMADCVAMNFIPVTTCTDLLRPGGYARLIRYLEKLGEKMRAVGATRLPDFVVRHCGQRANAHQRVMQEHEGFTARAICRCRIGTNCPRRIVAGNRRFVASGGLLERRSMACPSAMCASRLPAGLRKRPPRFRPPWWTRCARPSPGSNKLWWTRRACSTLPSSSRRRRKIRATRGSTTRACRARSGPSSGFTTASTVTSACPSAPTLPISFTRPRRWILTYDNFEFTPEGPPQRVPGGVFKVAKAHQLANYADACNDCGNCDVFCPEDGGPYIEKPRFFGSLETYRKYAGRNGFYIDFEGDQTTIYGTIAGASYQLSLNPLIDRAWFSDGNAEVEIQPSHDVLVGWKLKPEIAATRYMLDMLPYLQLKLLVESIRDPRHVNFANVAGI